MGLSLPSSSPLLCEEKEHIFVVLSHMFVQTGCAFAKQLIDESFWPDESKRTIKPDLRFGGIAGGKKFTHHSQGTLLFKFAEDVQLSSGHWVYGGSARNDRLAAKSAGHELKSTQALIDAGISQIRYPMMAAFSYRGKRVLCASLLPIRGKASLVQGKDSIIDAIKLPPVHVEAVMQGVATRLWLAKSREEIYGPFDAEIHEVDGFLYMVDAARLFPPEYRKGIHPGARQMYQLLRPELLRKVGVPIVPDALRYEDDEARRNLAYVCNQLDGYIAEVAHELELGQHLDCLSSRAAVESLLHGRGLNMRHLREVVASLDMGSVARSQLELVLAWRRPADEMDVKRLRHPRQLGRKELESVLELQRQSLRDGHARMQLVLTLLQLSDVVSDEVLLEKTMAKIKGMVGNLSRPAGLHPLVEAWTICETCDTEFVRSGETVTACSPQTRLVMYQILRRNLTFDCPSTRSLRQLVERVHTFSTLHISAFSALLERTRLSCCCWPLDKMEIGASFRILRSNTHGLVMLCEWQRSAETWVCYKRTSRCATQQKGSS